MSKSDFFFWGLMAVIGGVFASSFLKFSAFLLLTFLLLAVIAALIAIKKKSQAAILTAIVLLGFTLGVIRAELFWRGFILDEANRMLESPKFLHSLRNKFENAIRHILPEPESSLAAGILLGKSATFAPDFFLALKRTSTLHIVAVSGYNITVVASNVLRFFEMLRLPFLISWWGAVVAVLLFTLLVGAPASAVRAAIMGIVTLIGKRIGRTSPQRLALAFAAVLMLLWRPDLLRFDAGFQLSFLATIGIFWVAPIIEEKIFQGRKLWGLSRIVAETVGAQLVVAPWILYLFGNMAVLGMVANIAVLPILPLAMLVSFLGGIASMIGGIVKAIMAPVAYVPLALEVAIIKFAANLPFAAFEAARVSFWMVGVIYVMLFILLSYYWRQKTDE